VAKYSTVTGILTGFDTKKLTVTLSVDGDETDWYLDDDFAKGKDLEKLLEPRMSEEVSFTSKDDVLLRLVE
jgi:hypothetical protein